MNRTPPNPTPHTPHKCHGAAAESINDPLLRPYGGPLGSLGGLVWPLIKDRGEQGKSPGLCLELLSSFPSMQWDYLEAAWRLSTHTASSLPLIT